MLTACEKRACISAISLSLALALAAGSLSAQNKLPKPRRLDSGVVLRRDPATGELRRATPSATDTAAGSATIRTRVALVEVGCNVFAAGGAPVRGLAAADFRLYEDGVEQRIVHFDASTAAASIVLVLDTSPSVFRDLDEIRDAARTLSRSLAPQDEVAVVTFAARTRLVLPLTRDRALLERTIAAYGLPSDPEEARGSRIYESVYLAAEDMFGGVSRTGRKALVLLTDGQDTGMGLSWDPASAMPRPGASADRLTFEDVARALAARGVELYAITTQPRPAAFTDAWLAAHRSETLVSSQSREAGMPHYTLYLAELVRRAGGQLFFLREVGALGDVYRRIAESLSAQYILGFYPSAGLARPGWRSLRVELISEGPARARLIHRIAYYVSASP